MSTPFVIGIVAASVLSQAETGLHVEWLYNGAGRPIMVEVTPPMSAVSVHLVLMDADGDTIGDPVSVQAGRVDIAKLLPQAATLRRAAYLQLVGGLDPIGSALVVQPMLSREVPVTEDAVNPSGIKYTRIVGWYDEVDPDDVLGVPGDASGDGSGADRLFSGLRIYSERDVLLETTHGVVRLALRPDAAPNTAWNFLELCRGGFYRDIPFHRIVPKTPDGDPFVIQAGDPTATGSGGPGYWLPIERSRLPHDFGVISMARDVAPDSAGSQIFICLSRAGTARLDGHYCAFGQAVDGARAILDIAAAEIADAESGRPADPPCILSARLVASPPRWPGAGRPDATVTRQSGPQEGSNR